MSAPSVGSDTTDTTDSGSTDTGTGSTDTGTGSTGSTDAGSTDGGSTDGGSTDTGTDSTDTGTDSTDTGTGSTDGGSTDGGSADTGTDSTDTATGSTDGGSTDTGSTGSKDAGSPAAGPTTQKGASPQGSTSGPTAKGTSGNYSSTLFTFQLNPGESIGARIVRCCSEALSAGPMGQTQRHDFYRDFISCNQEKTQQAAEQLTKVATSCAMFVRAVREWCGAPAVGPYKPGTGMFVSMGNVSLASPAFVKLTPGAKPNPGDYFYIAPPPSEDPKGLKGHTGIFIGQNPDGSWQTAEGGGPPDGTTCRMTSRTISGSTFSNDPRTLWGWFDCTKVGIPAS